MKFGVISSRDRNGEVFENYDYVSKCLTQVVKGFCPNQGKGTVIVSGGGKGPETIAIEYANTHHFEVEKVVPHIKTLGIEKAFLARNRSIINMCDILIVFWTGENPTITAALNDAAFLERPVVMFPIV
jgi:hypothetical protein